MKWSKSSNFLTLNMVNTLTTSIFTEFHFRKTLRICIHCCKAIKLLKKSKSSKVSVSLMITCSNICNNSPLLTSNWSLVHTFTWKKTVKGHHVNTIIERERRRWKEARQRTMVYSRSKSKIRLSVVYTRRFYQPTQNWRQAKTWEGFKSSDVKFLKTLH